MANTDKRSFNNADLTPMQVAGFKKKAGRSTLLHVRMGSRKFLMPVDYFTITTESGHAFMSIPAINAVLRSNGDNTFEAVEPMNASESLAALKAHRVTSKKKTRTKEAVEMPAALKKHLSSIPEGYKLVLKGSGYELVKSRQPRAKAPAKKK